MDEEVLNLPANEELTSVLLPNPDAFKSRQMLSGISSDDDVEVDEEEEEEEEVVENGSSSIQIEEKDDLMKSKLSTTTQSIGRGRGSKTLSKQANIPPEPSHSELTDRSMSLIETPSESGEKLHHANSFPNHHQLMSYQYSNKSKYTDEINLNFTFETTATKIIFHDRCDYHDACRLLRHHRIRFEEARHYDDLWSFCLKSRTIRFYDFVDYQQQLENDPEMIPPSIELPIFDLLGNESKFWMFFERRPIFLDSTLNCDIEAMKEDFKSFANRMICAPIEILKSMNVKFFYGALTSMQKFCFHPSFIYSYDNRHSQWKIQFRLKRIEIIRSENKAEISYSSVLRADLIDRAAIFTISKSGFDLFICIKGNLSEYEQRRINGENRPESKRVSLNNDDCPTFSTLTLSFHSKKNPQSHAIFRIKNLFKAFLDFFNLNQIHVCFGSIGIERGCIIQSLPTILDGSSATRTYAITMLRHVGYSVIKKLHEQKEFYQKLIELAEDDDDKWYRLCLYVVRRASEDRFLNLCDELNKAEVEYEKQLKQCNALGISLATILSPPKENFAYVPSIRITPTTKQVRPLKLVKKHRLLREQNFDDPLSYALVEIRDESNRDLYSRDFYALRDQFRRYLSQCVRICGMSYEYLHHSMSQVKEKQFWFLNSKYSTKNVLSWIGNFDNERIVAKHAARIALGLTSTDPSIRIPAEHVKYIPDIENDKYCFTDGVGTISPKYCKMIQEALKRRTMPSVIQIRYGGCKGTLSVDPKLENQKYQLIIRYSMRKFMSDHDQMEICKVSSPRSFCLNRQDILLLSNRGVPESHFLVLQNEHHLWLVQALLCSSIAFELLNDRVGSMNFNFRDIANTINLVDEPFFLQLLITCGHDCVSKFQKRAKIKTDKNKARNMFGTVDEYGVLEYGQVFVQYSHMIDEKLDAADKITTMPRKVLDNVRVVITKNPCHHPGDIRTFTAVDRPELRHLVDVVVFPQKGPRPHPNEISGSDLDGDEYAVIWDPDLVPKTDNFDPYDYDSQAKPVPLDRPVERKDVNEIVLDIASQNLTGDMSNLHLALADALDPCHPEVLQLAGYISQELDAPKTGKHPISQEELNRCRNELLSEGYPDFMMKETVKSYTSKKIIGQLFRSARRAIIRWHQAARTHCSLRYLQATPQSEDPLINDSHSSQTNGHFSGAPMQRQPSLILDSTIDHPQAEYYLDWAKDLFEVYRESLLNIISVFNYQDEIDLFCRCENLDQLSTGKQDLNISAGLELQRLIDTTRHQFFWNFDRLTQDSNAEAPHRGLCTRNRQCFECNEIKLAQAAACYQTCYKRAAEQSSKARNRILSFPWLFASFLTELKRRNQQSKNLLSPSKWIVIGRAMRSAAKRLLDENKLMLKTYCSIHSLTANLYLRELKLTKENSIESIRRKNLEQDLETPSIPLSQALFIEIMNSWIVEQAIFGEYSPIDKKPLIRKICWHQLLQNFIYLSDDEMNDDEEHPKLPSFEHYQVVFQYQNNETMVERFEKFIREEISNSSSTTFDQSMYKYSIRLIHLCFRLARIHQSNEYAYLSDYLVLALQSIGIENDLKNMEI